MEFDCRKEFADFGDVVYLNTSYQAPIPLAAARAAQEALEWKLRPDRIPDRIHFDLPDGIRVKIGQIIGAQPDEIAITTGASAGMASVAAGIEWEPGDEVLVGQGEFPSHFSSWLTYERAGKLRIRVVPPRGRFITADDYLEHIGLRTRIVSASLVRFDNGARLDAARVAEACHRVGAFLLLDLAQCAGATPLAVRHLGADFAVCSGYKWLLGPYGTGFFWAAPEAAERLKVGPLYFMALEGARNFSMLPLGNQRAVPGSRRWDSPETANFTNLAGLDVSLDLILRLGVESIARYTACLVEEIIRQLPRSFALASPPAAAQRGPYVCIEASTPEKTAAMVDKLTAARIFVSLRENAIRIGPYIYNTREQISRLMEVLAAGS